jgi:hypothetical protein
VFEVAAARFFAFFQIVHVLNEKLKAGEITAHEYARVAAVHNAALAGDSDSPPASPASPDSLARRSVSQGEQAAGVGGGPIHVLVEQMKADEPQGGLAASVDSGVSSNNSGAAGDHEQGKQLFDAAVDSTATRPDGV